MHLLLDADATLAMRSLSLWQLVLDSSAALTMTGYVARSELTSIWSSELEAHTKSGRLRVEDVVARTPAWTRRKHLIEVEGADKGEAEALAWVLETRPEPPPWFVSVDARARQLAAKHEVPAFDLGELAALLVARGLADEPVVRAKIAVWDDRAQQRGRPHAWVDLGTTFAALLAWARTV